MGSSSHAGTTPHVIVDMTLLHALLCLACLHGRVAAVRPGAHHTRGRGGVQVSKAEEAEGGKD